MLRHEQVCVLKSAIIRAAKRGKTVRNLISEIREIIFEKNGLHVNEVLKKFQLLDDDTFKELIDYFVNEVSAADKLTFIYYIVLFRNDTILLPFLERRELPLEFYESLLLSVMAKACLDSDEDAAIDEILNTLPQKKLLQLVTGTKMIAADKPLVLYILSKMDIPQLELFFQDSERTKDFITGLDTLPEEMVRNVFYKSPSLHGYYIMLADVIEGADSRQIKNYNTIDSSEMAVVNKIVIEITNKYDLPSELKLPLAQRNKERFAYIVREVHRLEKVTLAMESLCSEGVIDIEEKSLITEIIGNPLFRDVLEKYTIAKQSDLAGFIF